MMMTTQSPTCEAVLLTVPPFPVHRRKLREWVDGRRKMSDATFKQALHLLARAGLVVRNRCGEYRTK